MNLSYINECVSKAITPYQVIERLLDRLTKSSVCKSKRLLRDYVRAKRGLETMWNDHYRVAHYGNCSYPTYRLSDFVKPVPLFPGNSNEELVKFIEQKIEKQTITLNQKREKYYDSIRRIDESN